jgi:hypothetical protein
MTTAEEEIGLAARDDIAGMLELQEKKRDRPRRLIVGRILT